MVLEMFMQRLQRFFYGRYGTDKFNLVLLCASLLLTFIGSIFFSPLYWLSEIILVYVLFRSLSRNIPARQRENQNFLQLWLPIENWFKFQKRRFSERKVYKYFKCPHCKQHLRAPRGRGKIEVTCQKCRTVFQTKA